MTNRTLIDVYRIADVATRDLDRVAEMYRALCDLSDELNSALPEYEVALLHLDTANYLCFTKRTEPTPDNYRRYLAHECEQRYPDTELPPPQDHPEGDEYA